MRKFLPLVTFLLLSQIALHAQSTLPWVCRSTTNVTANPVQMNVSVNGTQFVLDNGHQAPFNWHPRGFVIRGFTAELGWAQTNAPVTSNAQFAYGPAELNQVDNWDATMLRFLVSEQVLSDIHNTTYTVSVRNAYMNCLQKAVQYARNQGFVVDIAMQSEDSAGPGYSSTGLPTQHTMDAWQTVAGWSTFNFNHDHGVIYELYNESVNQSNPTDVSDATWNLYLHETTGVIAINTIIKALRNNWGSENVLLVDGLYRAKSLQHILDTAVVNAGGYPIHDPIQDSQGFTTPQIGYAVHVYPDAQQMLVSDFQARFGDENATLPVVVTEFAAWGTDSGTGGLGLSGTPVQPVIDLINYLNDQKIGLSASAFDAPGVIVQDVAPQGGTAPPNAWVKTYYNCYSTSQQAVPMPNVGILLYNFFTNDYDSTNYVLADGNDPSVPHSQCTYQ